MLNSTSFQFLKPSSLENTMPCSQCSFAFLHLSYLHEKILEAFIRSRCIAGGINKHSPRIRHLMRTPSSAALRGKKAQP